ncbi:MAG TPA: phytanoyl-CoA dioxygenase family protein [Gemmatimonadaceae bacterium]|jgi:ectoine hydroxylase-related dioxygenase (phytanoyl-CoA dioxygenase family)
MALLRVNCRTQTDWLLHTVNAVRTAGYMIVEGVLEPDFLAQTRERMYAVQKKIQDDVGKERLTRAGELGILRNMMKYDEFFLKYLELPEVLQVVDATVSSTAILHLQNGFILPSFPPGEVPKTFQNKFHMDFPRVLNGYLASINTLFAIDAFTADNGGTLAVPGTQQQTTAPEQAYLAAAAAPVECEAGSMLVFDSTLWHAAGANVSGKDRLGVNHQFTRSYIKQQVDYVRALGYDFVQRQHPRTQQLLGWYTRVVTSLDEFYQPEEKRLYRRGQG